MISKTQDILSLLKGERTSGISGTSKNLPFTKGEIVKGQVLGHEVSKLTKLRINGKEVSAQTSVKLQKGQIAFFKVEQLSPHCVLKILHNTSPNTTAGHHSLIKQHPYKLLTENLSMLMQSGKNTSLEASTSMNQLFETLSQMAIKPNDSFNSLLIMSLVYRSGLLWENKLKSMLRQGVPDRKKLMKIIEQDMKGLTLKLLKDSIDPEIRQKLMQSLSQLEQLQFLNKSGLEDNDRLLFMFPMLFDNDFTFGQMLFDFSGKKKAESTFESGVLKVSLFLQMSKIGPIRIDSIIFKRTIKVNFWVSEEYVENLINKNSYLLKEQLKRHGFYLQGIVCHVQEKNELDQTSFVEELVKDEHSFNLVV